jgi:translation initiation factor IF-2
VAKTLRVHTLAKELGVTSKEVIEKCRAEGVELKNHMAAISAGLAESIREWFSAGQDVTSIEVGDRIDVSKVRRSRKKAAAESATEAETATAVADVGESTVAPEFPETLPAGEEAEKTVEGEPQAEEGAPEAEETAPEPIPEVAPPESPTPPPTEPASAPEQAEPPAMPGPVIPPPPPLLPVRPAGPQVVPRPAELKGPRVVRIEAPEPVRAPRTRQSPAARGPSSDLLTPTTAPSTGRKGRGRGHGPTEDADGARGRSRSPRRHGRTTDVGERLKEWHEQDLIERKERLASATGMGLRERRAAERRRAAAAAAGPAARKAPVELTAPIALKEFCAAVGIPFSTVSKKLAEHTNRLWLITENIDADTLELLTMELEVPVTIAKQKTALERLKEEFDVRPREHAKARPPVVAMLGHVDHGKTSLLDAIRKAEVAAGEAGGITQHMGAYRVERGDWRVTFLDTPGHEAFTAMRARGANLTDVVVLVIAADDGVMPQTIEAINHARAAGVQIVVALNKIDVPNADINRVYSQLAAQNLIPSEWGGETDVIKTSAVTGEGIDELIAHLSTLSDLMELRADPTVPASATVIEAQMKEGQGVAAKVLVREGTLRPGQIVVCGGGYGRIRMLRDDRGRRVKEALPGWPVEVGGLDELPHTADQMYQVDDLKQAKDIAEEMRQRRREAELEGLRKPRTLEALLAAGDESQIPELNLIIKADVQGSVDVLKNAVGELPREKAQSRILHAAVGAISEADVHLARASDAIIIGFHVVAEDRARQLAEELGVQIRLYRVIYEMLDDVHKALAGLLEPVQQQEVRGAAEVRKLFNITRVGVVAGCRVTSGVVYRNNLVRVIRDGRIVAEDRAIGSLKHVKDDVREVRAGLECGIKLEGFDDIKPGDVLEAYEVVQVAQEL